MLAEQYHVCSAIPGDLHPKGVGREGGATKPQHVLACCVGRCSVNSRSHKCGADSPTIGHFDTHPLTHTRDAAMAPAASRPPARTTRRKAPVVEESDNEENRTPSPEVPDDDDEEEFTPAPAPLKTGRVRGRRGRRFRHRAPSACDQLRLLVIADYLAKWRRRIAKACRGRAQCDLTPPF